MTEVQDTGVLQRVAAGEPEAVRQCLDQFGGLVWSLANRFCRNHADAEDAVQEIFTEVWSKADRYVPTIASENTYVTMIARRRLIDRLRKDGRSPKHASIEDTPIAAPAQEAPPAEVQEEVQRVNAVIDQLNPKQQVALRMAIYENCTHTKIAEELDLPLGTVKTNIRRGLMRVREMLGVQEEPGNGQSR